MGGQFVYALLTEMPAVFLLYDSPIWSAGFLLLIFSVSVWNGGAFYIEVFGRKFERELEALRKEIAASAARSTPTTPDSDVPPLTLDHVHLEVPSSPTFSSDGSDTHLDSHPPLSSPVEADGNKEKKDS